VTPGRLLDAALRRDGARPLLTWYDDRSGERIELSVATASNWAAKTANFLADEHGLDDSDAIGLAPTSHWLSVVVLLGAWTAGIGVDLTGAARSVVLPGDPTALMRAVLPQPDSLLIAPATGASVGIITAVRNWTLAELVAAAAEPGPRSRVLATRPLDTAEAIADAVVTPLACDGSAVLVTNPDADKLAGRAQTEHVTHTAGFDLAGLPRLRS
jgi:hypothetical protein